MKRYLSVILIVVLVLSQSCITYAADQPVNIEEENIENIIGNDYPVNEGIKLELDDDDNVIESGSTVTATALSIEESVDYEYCFVSPGENKELLREFSEDNQYSFGTDQAGVYTIRVILRDEYGNLSMQECVYEVVEPEQNEDSMEQEEQPIPSEQPNRENDSLDADQIDDESNGEILQNYDENETDNENKYEGTDEQNIDPLVLEISSDKSGTQSSGSIVTISAEVKGGDGEYEYRFTETYNGVSTTVQNYSEKSTYEYRAKGDGVHKFTVAVRDGSGNTMSGTYSVTVREESLSLSLSSDKSGTQPSGSIVTISAEAKGGDGEYEYRFTETYNGVSTTVQNYSEKSTYEYRAKGDGVHKFTVAVRDGSGNTMSGTYSVTVREESLSLSLSSDKSGTQPSGSIVTISAEAKGGDGEYEYRFTETYNGVSTTVQNYSEKSTYEYRAKGDGVHKFTVAVRDGRGTTISGTYSITVLELPLQITIQSNKGANVKPGQAVTLTANATGGVGEYEYRFTETFQGISTTKQGYSSENTYSFTTGELGEYKYTVAVRDTEGQITSAIYTINVTENVTLQGIDVSAWQGQINWSQVKSSGVSFAMLRALSGTMSNLTVDSQFLNNAIGASSNGIEIGAYRYGYATTVEEARKEALMTIQAIKTAESNGAKFTYPIAYDVEDEATQGKLSKSELTAIIKEFQSVIESYGYKFMIYANRNWLTTKIDMEEFSDVDVWVASWFNDNTPNHDHGYRGPGNVTIWQYTSQGSVPGISGYVDMNVGYGDY